MTNGEEIRPTGYTEIFNLINKAGGPGNFYKSGNLLTSKERQKVVMNYWAFFFTIFFYLKHKMRKKSLTLLAITTFITYITFLILYDFLGVKENSFRDFGFNLLISGIFFGTYVNIDLYKRYQLNKNNWW